MSTQPRKNRAGWISLGWLTDADLVERLRAYRTSGSYDRPMSQCVKEVLRAGLDALESKR